MTTADIATEIPRPATGTPNFMARVDVDASNWVANIMTSMSTSMSTTPNRIDVTNRQTRWNPCMESAFSAKPRA